MTGGGSELHGGNASVPGWQRSPSYQHKMYLEAGRNKGSVLEGNKDFKVANALELWRTHKVLSGFQSEKNFF